MPISSSSKEFLGLLLAVLFVVPGLFWWYFHAKVVEHFLPLDDSLLNEGSWRQIIVI